MIIDDIHFFQIYCRSLVYKCVIKTRIKKNYNYSLFGIRTGYGGRLVRTGVASLRAQDMWLMKWGIQIGGA